MRFVDTSLRNPTRVCRIPRRQAHQTASGFWGFINMTGNIRVAKHAVKPINTRVKHEISSNKLAVGRRPKVKDILEIIRVL